MFPKKNTKINHPHWISAIQDSLISKTVQSDFLNVEEIRTYYPFPIDDKFIVQISAIKEMFNISRNRVRRLLDPAPALSTGIIVSEDCSEAFRDWLNR